MSGKDQTHENDKASSQKQPAKLESLDITRQQIGLPTIDQQGQLAPQTLTPNHVLQLQRIIGNQAVNGLLSSSTFHASVPNHGPNSQLSHRENLSLQSKPESKEVMTNEVQNNSPSVHTPIQGQTVLQRRSVEFRNTKNEDEDAVLEAVDEIDNQVQLARDLALQWNQYQGAGGYLGAWYIAANLYFNNPGIVPGFLHARFGYAVETIACNNLPAQLNGLTVNFQVTQGATRPDIVLMDDDNNHVAWIDLTAEGSEGHIKGKAGGGWRSRPYVYEVLYDSLDAKEVLEGMNDPLLKEAGGFLADNRDIEVEEFEKQVTNLRDSLTGLQENEEWQTGFGNKSEKRNVTRDLLQNNLDMDLGNSSLKATRGALALANVNDGPFGFNQTNIGTNSLPAKNWARAEAQDDVDNRQEDLRTGEAQGLTQHLEDWFGVYDAVDDWYNSINAVTDDEIDWDGEWDVDNQKILNGIALKHAINSHESLTEDVNDFDIYNEHPLAAQYVQNVQNLKATFPTQADFNALNTYHRTAVALDKSAHLVYDQMNMEDSFKQYLNQYYDNWQNDLEDEEQTILDDLAKYPDNRNDIDAAQTYMNDNPL